MHFVPGKGEHDDEDPVEDVAAGEEGEQVEPEPEEEVDLFVDDVEREHAQAVELLLARRRAHAVERATERKID